MAQLPPNLDLTDGNLADSFRKWKRQLEVYMEASGANNKPKQRQTAIILHCAGPQVLEVYDHFHFEADNDKNDPAKVLEKLEEYCNPRENEVLQSFRFWNMPFHEPFDVFLTELYSRAASCNFKEKVRMIRDKIVFSVSGKLQELLLRESNLDLKKATEIYRAFEITSRAKKEMSPPSEGYPIDKIEAQHQEQNNAVKPQQKDGPCVLNECKFCGQSHEAARTQCPAWGKTCNYCKGRNHFEVKCKKVNLLNAGRDYDECDEQWLVVVGTDYKRATALMQVNGCEVRFQSDSGADVNTICQKFVEKSQVKSTSQKLIMWNKSTVTPLGQVTLEILNPKNTQVSEADFIVVPNDFSCLLGLKTVQEMGLFTINKENFIAEVTSNTSPLGNLAKNCEACQLHKPWTQKETLTQHEEGETPWSKIGIDLFEMKGRNYLVTVEYYSNVLEVDYLSTTTTKQVITKLKGHFARYGILLQMVTDSGPQFLSREFRNFTTEWEIQRVMSSPDHHLSNGKAEDAVKITKTMTCKALRDGTDQYAAILELRNTPRQNTGISPAEMMFGRNTRSLLPSTGSKSIPSKKQVQMKRAKRHLAIKSNYNKETDLKRLTPSQPVYYQYNEGRRPEWRIGTVRTEHSERSDIIDGKDGVYRRNRVHLRLTTPETSPEKSSSPASALNTNC